jgi:hypothetical protein
MEPDQIKTETKIETINPPVGINDLINAILEKLKIPTRSGKGTFLFSIDHCF